MNRRKSCAQHAMPIIVLLPFFLLAAGAKADSDAAEIIEIIGAVEAGWEDADGTSFRKHFLDFSGAGYIESGGQN